MTQLGAPSEAKATIRLTAAQALTRMMAAQSTAVDGECVPFFAGVWAIFGHGNVAGLGEALHAERERLPVFRAHNEQAMVHAATAFTKTARRRRVMACTTSIGPGALNMVTGAAVAHVNRLPVLLLPGDVFASRRPDPVLQQLEDWGDGTASVNDAFRPVSRYFDRITRPEQLVPAFARAMAVLTDPAECGPVTLSLCQDVQAEAFDFPRALFEPRVHRMRRPPPDPVELAEVARLLRHARRPLLIAGGGVLASEAERTLARFAAERGMPVAETQAGKSSLAPDHALGLGGIGVAGTAAANAIAADADLVLAVGTRLADFTTGSWSLFASGPRLVGLNTQPFDAAKHGAQTLVADAQAGLEALGGALGAWCAPAEWTERAERARTGWRQQAAAFTGPDATAPGALPSDAAVIGAVARAVEARDILLAAAGGLPGELQRHWEAGAPGGYHMEYGFSCMGYEIAGAIGAKLAAPDRTVIAMLGDGSYLMMNSELATAAAMALSLVVVLLDNRGYGCINRLQEHCGGAPFNNLWRDSWDTPPSIDFAAHARSLGVRAEHVADVGALEAAIKRVRLLPGPTVLVIDTDPAPVTDAGGHWWDVAVPEVSERAPVRTARNAYDAARARLPVN